MEECVHVQGADSYPAGSTGALISDLLQCWAVGPLLSGVERFRQLDVSGIPHPAQYRARESKASRYTHNPLV